MPLYVRDERVNQLGHRPRLSDVRSLLRELSAAVLPISDLTATTAPDAFARCGTARTGSIRRKLNFGYCFSYAGTKSRRCRASLSQRRFRAH